LSGDSQKLRWPRGAEADRARRNLNPTAPAIVAMGIWSHEYAAQRGGVMDFWDSLSESRKRQATEEAERIRTAAMTE
jgi:hypothetical protein